MSVMSWKEESYLLLQSIWVAGNKDFIQRRTTYLLLTGIVASFTLIEQARIRERVEGMGRGQDTSPHNWDISVNLQILLQEKAFKIIQENDLKSYTKVSSDINQWYL